MSEPICVERDAGVEVGYRDGDRVELDEQAIHDRQPDRPVQVTLAKLGGVRTDGSLPSGRHGAGLLELVRTQEIVRRHLPPGSLQVLDVGDGAGVHAEWLAGDGHAVHLIDPMERHVEAADRLGGAVGRVTAEVGDARELPAANGSADVVLLLGPLYHLTVREDRVRALREAARVVRPGGGVFVAAISRFASLIDGLRRQFLFDPRFRSIVEADLRDGQHRNPDREPHWLRRRTSITRRSYPARRPTPGSTVSRSSVWRASPPGRGTWPTTGTTRRAAKRSFSASVGRLLCERFFELARRDSRTRVAAVTSAVNEGSIAFHRRMGFDVSDPIDGYDRPGVVHVRFSRHLF